MRNDLEGFPIAAARCVKQLRCRVDVRSSRCVVSHGCDVLAGPHGAGSQGRRRPARPSRLEVGPGDPGPGASQGGCRAPRCPSTAADDNGTRAKGNPAIPRNRATVRHGGESALVGMNLACAMPGPVGFGPAPERRPGHRSLAKVRDEIDEIQVGMTARVQRGTATRAMGALTRRMETW